MLTGFITIKYGRKGLWTFFRKEDIGPVKVGSYHYVKTRYIIATKNHSESETSSSEEETDSDSDHENQVNLLCLVIAIIDVHLA